MAPELVNVREFQQLAREALTKMYYDFYAGGAEDEFSLKENMEAFRRITYYFFTDDVLIVVNRISIYYWVAFFLVGFSLNSLRPRVLVDVSRINMSTTILGYRISAPIMIAPTAMHQLAHPEGKVATAKPAAACNTIRVLSFNSTCTFEEVALSCNAIRFFQLYVHKRRDVTAAIVDRAERLGYKALVLTVDVP